MGFFNDLILNVTKESAFGAMNAGSTAALGQFDGTVKLYTSKPYENIFVYAAKREVLQRAFAEMNNLYPSLRHKLEREKMIDAYNEHQGDARKKIIDHNRNMIKNENAWMYRGHLSNEGFLMWIKNKDTVKKVVPLPTYWDKIKNLSGYDKMLDDNFIDPKHADTYAEIAGESVFLDMTAIVNANSSKNLVLTKVQGRDYSRKELISNGDMQFSISGKIVGNSPDTYPYGEVATFVKLMQYKGVVQVYGLLFEQLGVTQILVKDFRLSQNVGFKNVQPYSFTCVAVEPDEKAEEIEDTLISFNLDIANNKKKGPWVQLLKKVYEGAITQASTTIQQLTADII